MPKDDLVAEYERFMEGCEAGCRGLENMTQREYAGMLVQLYGPGALHLLDEDEDAAVYDLVLEATKDLPECVHASCEPKRGFEAEKSKDMSPHKARNAYPPFVGQCPDCGYQVVVFASGDHEALFEDES